MPAPVTECTHCGRELVPGEPYEKCLKHGDDVVCEFCDAYHHDCTPADHERFVHADA